jgi:hypothetical protein
LIANASYVFAINLYPPVAVHVFGSTRPRAVRRAERLERVTQLRMDSSRKNLATQRRFAVIFSASTIARSAKLRTTNARSR